MLSAADILRLEHISPKHSLPLQAFLWVAPERPTTFVKDHLIHDPLQIGVATMLAEALSKPWICFEVNRGSNSTISMRKDGKSWFVNARRFVVGVGE